MKIDICDRNSCENAQGLCVVIDVMRAFTTAAFAFDSGAREIVLVAHTEDAFDLHQKDSSLVMMGEVNGYPIEGFHYGNSPEEISKVNLLGKRLVQRTSSGTQGVVKCKNASHMLLGSFVVAEATIRRIYEIAPEHVSFIVTGLPDGDEDLAFAEYLKHKLEGENVSAADFLQRVRRSPTGRRYGESIIPEFRREDLELALQLDRFPFAMEVLKIDGYPTARKLMFTICSPCNDK